MSKVTWRDRVKRIRDELDKISDSAESDEVQEAVEYLKESMDALVEACAGEFGE